MKKTVYLSLGSNIGKRESNLRTALEHLRTLGRITAVSAIYETEPVGFTAQPWFLNCTLALETELMPKQLLGRTQNIERQMGRTRGTRAKGPRTIDIDILLFGKAVVQTRDLVIPHLALHERRFVLEPLAEIAPELRHPVFHATIRELRDAVAKDRQAIRRVGNF